jgi:hypothetical protein
MNSIFLNQYTLVLDACVLAPMPIADTLLRLGEAEFYVPKWSNQILLEVREFLKGRGKTQQQIDHRFEQMSAAFEDACVTGYEDLIESLTLPDKDDRHVLAAAIRGHAHSIVTENVKDFPEAETEKYGITVQKVDTFLVDQYDLNPNRFISVLMRQAAAARVDPSQLLVKLNAPSLGKLLRLGTGSVKHSSRKQS